jgi:hypothetical protein
VARKHRTVEIRWDPESEKRFRERLASPEGQRLLDELAIVFAHAAIDRMLEESDDRSLKMDPAE